MPDDKSISELTNAQSVNENTLFEVSNPDSGSATGYSSYNANLGNVADTALGFGYPTRLDPSFTNKTIFGALNELKQGGGGGGSSTLAGLSDVNLTSPTDGQALVYDATNQEWVNGTGGGGNADFVELTQAEYDALEQAGQLQEDVMYFITDGQSGNEIIDDTTTSASKVWSSQKTNSELSALGATIPAINDSSTASTVVWSGNKIDTELATKQDDLSCGQLANVDLDDYKTNGFYWVSQTNVSNKPATNFGYLIVAKPSTVIQIFVCFANDTTVTRGDMYVRFYANNQWYGWNKIASSRPEPVKATRTGLTIAASTTSYFTFSGIAVKSGYTRMVTCANPSEGGLFYLRTVENGNDLRIYINNSTGASVTFDLTIMVEYIAT